MNVNTDRIAETLPCTISATQTERGSIPPTMMSNYQTNNLTVMMKTLVINVPDNNTVSGAVNLRTNKDEKLKLMQKQLELKRGLQEYSPRTSAPPMVKHLDQHKFKTIATRNFNA